MSRRIIDVVSRGQGNRGAIEESASFSEDSRTIKDADQIVGKLREIKFLKEKCLEEPNDKKLADQLEALSDEVKVRLEAILREDPDAAQELMARGYREAAFDPIDLSEMGFNQQKKELLSERMTG